MFNIQVSEKTHKELTDCEDSFKSLFSTGVSEHYDKLALSSAFIETFCALLLESHAQQDALGLASFTREALIEGLPPSESPDLLFSPQSCTPVLIC